MKICSRKTAYLTAPEPSLSELAKKYFEQHQRFPKGVALIKGEDLVGKPGTKERAFYNLVEKNKLPVMGEKGPEAVFPRLYSETSKEE